MTSVAVSNAVLWALMLGVIVALWVLARRVGRLHERVAAMGSQTVDPGPRAGERAPHFELQSLTGADVTTGGERTRTQLIFFLSPTCPLCKKLLPVLRACAQAERDHVDVVLAGEGDPARHLGFLRDANLAQFPCALSAALVQAYRVNRLPHAVLIDRQGVIRATGPIDDRSQLESLFRALAIDSAPMPG
ncbi:MAG: redoxin family protein [Betaproteobacteria bacterium]